MFWFDCRTVLFCIYAPVCRLTVEALWQEQVPVLNVESGREQLLPLPP
jgi:hypothetical protein